MIALIVIQNLLCIVLLVINHRTKKRAEDLLTRINKLEEAKMELWSIFEKTLLR